MKSLQENLRNIEELKALTGSINVMQDLAMSLCGRLINEGSFRSVYEYNLDSDYVIKVEWGNSRCNIVEYMMWNEIQHLQKDLAWVKEWFAPVEWISPNGRLLVMKRTKPIQHSDLNKLPEKVPAFLWDIKPDNFGWLGKKLVCHDYGQFYNFIHYSKKLKKANW